jgi:hypothetical protein
MYIRNFSRNLSVPFTWDLGVSFRGLWRLKQLLCFFNIIHVPTFLFKSHNPPSPTVSSLVAHVPTPPVFSSTWVFLPLRTSVQSPAHIWDRVIHLPWRWRRYVPPKRRFKHGATSQKTIFFNHNIIHQRGLRQTWKTLKKLHTYACGLAPISVHYLTVSQGLWNLYFQNINHH